MKTENFIRRMDRFSVFRIVVVSLLCLSFIPVYGQEINANVQVDRSRISSTSLNYLDNFAEQLETYLNDNTWTNDNFQSNERINATIQINLLGVRNDYTFDANIIIRSMRPIYNSTSQTTVFLYNDENWTFTYSPNRGLVRDELQFDALSTLLDFYAYVIIGFDYDTFSELGGTPYFSEAQNLVSLAQSSSAAGWERSTNVPRNRAQLMADILNPNYEPLRRAIYVYHRQGLDLFLQSPEKARSNVMEALQMIQKAQRQTTSNLLFDTFFNAKYREIVSLFEGADPQRRLQAYNLLSEIDPAHMNEYYKLQ